MKLTTKEITIFALLGAIMFSSKKLMEILPNVHLLGLIIVTMTVVYRQKALYPLYVYVLLDGIFAGFATWWLPYLYIWTVLWGATMLIPRRLPKRVAFVVYILVSGLHGLAFGTLYAPFQAIVYGLDFEGFIAWIVAGLPYDAIHGLSNAIMATLVIPLTKLFKKFGGLSGSMEKVTL